MTTLNIERLNALPSEITPSTLYILKGSESDLAELYFSSEDGLTVRHLINKEEIIDLISTNTSLTSDGLTTARSLSMTGDGSWTVVFDGTDDVTADFTLPNVVIAGEYPITLTDSKGRTISGRLIGINDIPSLPGDKLFTDISVNTTGNAATATKFQTSRSINGTAFDGTSDIVINAVDTTARIASSEKGVANGVATLDSGGLIPSSQLPSFVDDVLEYPNFGSFPGTGLAAKIYVSEDDSKIYRWTGTQYLEVSRTAGTADAATQLATIRKISITGDGTWYVNFDGTTDVNGIFTLASTGITAGTGAITTFDGKGRALTTRDLQVSDIPGLDHNKVSSSASVLLAEVDW
jgi:hypothetical protein